MNSALRLALVAVVVLVPAVGLGIGWRASGPTAEASAPVALVLAPVVKGANPVAVAPVPRQADEKLQKDIAAAREKAIDFLKKKHDENTHWEGALLNALADMEGGMTALATLGLLEAGVAVDDAVVAKAIDYLAKLEPKKTYVVSLQTQVLARADAKKYKEQIQKNADWLLEKMIGKEDKIEGWSYPGNLIADNSNTHFAVMGLHAAAQAGAKIDRKVWDRLREFYTRTQARDGGWMYHNEFASQSSLSMTTCGLLGLTIADKYDKNAKQPGEVFEKGIKKLVPWTMENPKSTFYAMHAVAELGRAAGKTEFKSGDKTWAWYREGASKLLKEQKADGSWATGTTSVDGSPVYATACALYFLGPAKK